MTIIEDLWLITGDGYFFHDFFLPARNHSEALARAQDILAGCTATQPRDGKRFYDTVDTHIKNIVKTGVKVKTSFGNYHSPQLVMLDTH